jgi:hypothetical protein
MTDETYDDDLDDAEDVPQRMPFTVLAPIILFGGLALITGFAAIVNLGDPDRLAAGVFLGSVTLAVAVTAGALVRGSRFGSYLGFGLAFLLALTSLRDVGTALVGFGFLAAVMGCLMTRSAKDWFGFV